MNIVAALLPILMVISALSALAALVFLQSRASGIARILIITGSVLAIPVPLGFTFFPGRQIIHALIAAGSTNTGIILLSIGVILFAFSLPSRRFRNKQGSNKAIEPTG